MPRHLCLTFCLAITLSLLTGCGGDPDPEPVDTTSYAAKQPETQQRPASRGQIRMTDVTAASGIDFLHETGAFGKKWMPESLASGVVVFDYDGDARDDILFLNGTAWPGRQAGAGATPRLYRNVGGMAFEEVTREAGLAITTYAMGAAAGDFDADGDLDLYVTSVWDNVLLRNDAGRFVDVTEQAGVAGGRWTADDGTEHPEWSTAAAWVDVDGDGWIDLFVGNYVRWSPDTDLFTSIDGENKSYATPQEYQGLTCRLFRNTGQGRFVEVTEQAGVYNPEGKTMGVAVSDYDNDGDPDLFVTNDTQPNFLYKNDGSGTFEDVALTAGVAFDGAGRARAGMGVDVAAVDTAGSVGIAIGNFSRESLSLYVQSWEDLFIDFAGKMRVATPSLLPLTFGVVFADIDLDGFQDLVCVNGHLEPEINTVQKEITYAQLPQLFRNDGRGRFEDAGAEAGNAFERPIVGRGLAYGDLDGDGDIDLVMTENGGRPVLARNDSDVGSAVRFRLVGKSPNTHAFGARVSAKVAGRWEIRMVRTGSSYLSQNETVLTFGVGAQTAVDSVVVAWPDGTTKTITDVRVDRLYTVDQGGTIEEDAFVRAN